MHQARIPYNGDKRACRDTGDSAVGIDPSRIERGQDDRRKGCGIDSVGIQRLFQNRHCVSALDQGPDAQANHHQPRDQQNALVAGLRIHVAKKDIVDQIRCRRKR